MELRHLRYFIAIAEERNFTRAALRLRIAQPALSQQIQRLEESLQVRLVDRSARRIALTRAGEEFLHHARGVLIAASEAVRAARALALESPALTLAFVGSAAYTLLPMLIRSFRKQAPEIRLVCVEMPIAEQLEALADGKIDAALVRPPLADPALAHKTLVDEAFLLAVPDDIDLPGNVPFSVRELGRTPLVMFARGLAPGFAELLADYCRTHEVQPLVVAEAVQVHTMLALVGGGVGAAFVPASAARIATPGVRFVSLREATPRARYCVAWRRDRAPAGIAALTARRFTLDADRTSALAVAPSAT